MTRQPIIGVLGASDDPTGYSNAKSDAQKLGEGIAKAGAILLCGGGGGIIEAAVAAAKKAGGHTIGILPSKRRSSTTSVEVQVDTEMGDGRNFINAFTSDVLVALPGGPGTLSEIAFALKLKRPVVYFPYWAFLNAAGLRAIMPVAVTPADAVALALAALGIKAGDKIAAPVEWPKIIDQSGNEKIIRDAVTRWGTG